MANLRIAGRPIVVIDRAGDGFTVTVWHPPGGIWRQIGEPNVELDAAATHGQADQYRVGLFDLSDPAGLA